MKVLKTIEKVLVFLNLTEVNLSKVQQFFKLN